MLQRKNSDYLYFKRTKAKLTIHFKNTLSNKVFTTAAHQKAIPLREVKTNLFGGIENDKKSMAANFAATPYLFKVLMAPTHAGYNNRLYFVQKLGVVSPSTVGEDTGYASSYELHSRSSKHQNLYGSHSPH